MTLIPGRKRGLNVTELEGFPQNTAQFLRADGVFAVPAGAGGGDVTGPASAVSADVAVFSGATGKAIADSGVAIANVVLTADSRLSNARTPTAHAASHTAAGSDPVALSESQVTGLVADLAARVLTSDSRLSDARTPTAHATSHKSGGTDAVKLDELAAPTDITTLNASTGAHGLLKKLSNVPTEFMNGQGAWAAPTAPPTEQTTSATGTQNNFDLNGRFTYLACSGAAPIFTGFTVLGSAPSQGDRVIIDNVGTGTTKVAHENASSTAAHRVICPSTAGQIIGAKGRMELVYSAADSRWREALVDPGAWITPAYAAGDFTGEPPVTWAVDAGDLTTLAYQQRGKWVIAVFWIGPTSVGGTPSDPLYIRAFGFTTTKNLLAQTLRASDNGTLRVGYVATYAGDTRIVLGISANWALCTNNTTVFGSVEFEVD